MNFFFDLSFLCFLIDISIETNLQKINSEKQYNLNIKKKKLYNTK